MRFAVKSIVILAILFSGYWVAVSEGVDRGLEAWLGDRRAEGWQADAAVIETKGYPTGFETRFEDVELADPETGLAWRAPEFALSAASISPTRIRAIWPESQTVASPFERITIGAERMEGVLDVAPGTALELREADIEIAALTLLSDAGWQAGLGEGRLNVTQSDTDDAGYSVFFEATDVLPSAALRELLDPSEVLPSVFKTLAIDADAEFDRPWDRFAVEDRRPQPRRIDLRKLQATWGELDLQIAGDITIDTAGVPEGDVSIRAVNWREMVQIGEAAGLIPPEMAGTVERALEVLAGLSGNPNTIDAPLTLSGGRISLGIVPLGPAPKIIIR